MELLNDSRAMELDLTEDRTRQLAPGKRPPPLPPLRFSLDDTGAGVRVTVVNDGPLGRMNGSVRYDVYWAATVDTTTAAGKATGFARAVCLAPSIPATNIDHTQSSGFYADPKYAAGYFYLCGVDALGIRSAPTEPARVLTGPVDYTIPGHVRHLQISESGVVANGTVFSELSVTALPPDENRGSFGWLQLYLKDYVALGGIQEAYSHRWLGSGSINFSVPYPIPRRTSTVAATATLGSDLVTAASGFLAIAQEGDQFELLGFKSVILAVTDIEITLTDPWPKANVTTADYVIIGNITVYGVAVSKAGTRAELSATTPSVEVLMDGDLSAPNAPASVTATPVATGVRILWDQVAGSTIKGYNIYRSSGITPDAGMANSPPEPASGTLLIDTVEQNANLPGGSTYVGMQTDDTKFTLYELETNAVFNWYVTTINTRGDESAAEDVVGACRAVIPNELDPTLPSLADPKNFIYNSFVHGTDGVVVAADELSQDETTGADASNLPGRPYGAATGQANGTGRFLGYTRLESNDDGTGAAGAVTFEGEDEVEFDAPGLGKRHVLYGEVGAWDHGTAVHRKIERGGVYVLSAHLNHQGVTPNGTFTITAEQMNDGTSVGLCLLRVRDSGGTITSSADVMDLDGTVITSESTRYYGVFQTDASLANSKQIRYSFTWDDGTVGSIRMKKIAWQKAEFPPPYTADMGDTTVSIPNPATPTEPVGDRRRERFGDIYLIAT